MVSPVCAQEFEVATLKLSPPPQGDRININLGTAANGRVALTNATLSDCLKFAYGIAADGQLVAPDWARSVRYDVVGQAPAPTPREELLIMLQKLLAERLKVVSHKEQRELAYLAVVQARGGSKLRPATLDAATLAVSPAAPNIRGRIVSARMPMSILALLLSRFEKQTVLDRTGLDGFFEVKLEWTPERDLASPTGTRPAISNEAPSLFAAIQEQLGLRLESRKGPMEVLVVDSAERTPADN